MIDTLFLLITQRTCRFKIYVVVSETAISAVTDSIGPLLEITSVDV